MHAERFAEAHAHINAVTNEMYNDLKARLVKNLNLQEAMAKTNSSKGPDAKPLEAAPADANLEAVDKKPGDSFKKPENKSP